MVLKFSFATYNSYRPNPFPSYLKLVLRATGSRMFPAKKLCLTAFSWFTNDHELALPLPAFPARVSVSESVMVPCTRKMSCVVSLYSAKSCNLLLSGNRLAQHVADCRVCVVETNCRCRDGVKVSCCHSYLVWMLFLGSTPTYTCVDYIVNVILWAYGSHDNNWCSCKLHTWLGKF